MEWLSSGSDVLIEKILSEGKKVPAQEDAGEQDRSENASLVARRYLEWDVVIVGSGYGGAVAASRLARAGIGRICVLERGKEYLPGEFPNDIGMAPAYVSFDRWDRTTKRQRKDALFDFRFGKGVTTLTGRALGGTSQINANVALRADPRVFQQDRWPLEFRDGFDPLDGYYTTVEEWLQVSEPRGWQKDGPQKYRELKRMHQPVQKDMDTYWRSRGQEPDVRCKPAPLAVTLETPEGGKENPYGVKQHACVGCGDCVTGCNHWAKNTLTMNYLPDAVRQGVEMFTGVDVVRVEVDRNAARGGHRYRVLFDETVETALGRCQKDECNKQPKSGDGKQGTFELRARAVILAGGVLGSPEILMRSAEGEHGLRVSERLGHGVSLNGDSIAFGYDQTHEVNGVGWGSRRVAEMKKSTDNFVGPTITGVLDTRHGVPVGEGALIEDGIIPGAIERILHEWLTTNALFAQLGECAIRDEWKWESRDPLAPSDRALKHTQTYLMIAHDSADGRIRLRDGYAFIDWPEATNDSNPHHEELLRRCEDLGGVFLDNPSLRPVPKQLSSALAGTALRGTYLSVHPLGGAPMGDDIESGVVNHYGAVFDGESAQSVHPGLFVLDGSIVPTSLGANPFLTIAAIAERAIEFIRLDLEHLFAGDDSRERPDRARDEAPAETRSGWKRQSDSSRAIAGNPDPEFHPELPALPSPLPKPYENPNLESDGVTETGVCLVFKETLRSFVEMPAHASGTPRNSLKALEHFKVTDEAGKSMNFEKGDPVAAALSLTLGPVKVSTLLRCPKHEIREVSGTLRLSRKTSLRPLAPNEPLIDVAEFRVERGTVSLLAPRSSGCRIGRILRGMATWYEARGRDDTAHQYLGLKLRHAVRESLRKWSPRPVAAFSKEMFDALVAVVRLNYHVSELREFRYSLDLRNERDGARLRIEGVKDLRYPQDRWWWPALRRLVTFFFRSNADRKSEDLWKSFGYNWWQELTELGVELQGCDFVFKPPILAAGRLRLDLVRFADDNIAQVVTEQRVPDTPRALLGLAQVGLLFLRVMLKTHFWDFKAPEYANPMGSRDLLPGPHKKLEGYPPERILFSVEDRDDSSPGQGDREPEAAQASAEAARDGTLRAVASGGGGAHGEPAGITLYLTRYDASKEAIVSKGHKGPILLLHGFAQSSCAFVNEDMDEDLVCHLHRDGYDVWLLDYRHSIALQSSRELRDLDEAARYDVKRAIETILRHYNSKPEFSAPNNPLASVTVFGHCMGAVLVSMAALSGRLVHGEGPHAGQSMIKAAVLSQVPPFLVGGLFSQCKIELAAFIRDYLKVDVVNLSARGEPSMWFTVADRLMGTIPVGDEVCPDEFNRFGLHPQEGIGTCKRISSIIGRLYRHDNLSRNTHDRLPKYFGWANIAVFAQIAKFFQYERIVDANGANVYATRERIKQYMGFPILFLHGEENVVFDVESARRSLQEFELANPQGTYELRIVPNYAHYDCIVGERAAEHVFAYVTAFLNKSRDNARSGRALPLPVFGRGTEVLAPQVGPWITGFEVTNGAAKLSLKVVPSREWSIPPTQTYAFQEGHSKLNPFSRHSWNISNPGDTKGPESPIPGRTFVQDIGMLRLDGAVRTPSPAEFGYWVADTFEFDDGGPTDFGPVGSVGPDLYDRLKKRHTWLEAISKEPEPRSLSRRFAPPAPLELAKVAVTPALVAACTSDSAIAFFVSCCRHPGTGFEQTLSDRTYEGMAKRLEACVDGSNKGLIVPQLGLLVGDQIYADAWGGIFDTARPIERYVVRYRAAFGSKNFRNLARQLPVHMAIDDHEIWDNYSGDEIADDPARGALAASGFEAARAFQGLKPPGRRAARMWYSMTRSGFDFFVLDTRSGRDRRMRNGRKRLMTEAQWKALGTWLASAKGERPRFIVSGSVVLPRTKDVRWANDRAQSRSYKYHPETRWDSWSAFPDDRERLLKTIVEHRVQNVVFVSGDYHVGSFSELSVCSADGKVSLRAYSVVCPPAYAPFPFANDHASNILRRDELVTADGIRVTVATATDDGSGFAEVRVRQDRGKWALDMECFDQSGNAFSRRAP
jgi:choline dehydrogenase-like flavoprotein/pimeloyl-ACP methyl ester carboxylesterase